MTQHGLDLLGLCIGGPKHGQMYAGRTPAFHVAVDTKPEVSHTKYEWVSELQSWLAEGVVIPREQIIWPRDEHQGHVSEKAALAAPTDPTPLFVLLAEAPDKPGAAVLGVYLTEETAARDAARFAKVYAERCKVNIQKTGARQ